jgi:hypothetical protein
MSSILVCLPRLAFKQAGQDVDNGYGGCWLMTEVATHAWDAGAMGWRNAFPSISPVTQVREFTLQLVFKWRGFMMIHKSLPRYYADGRMYYGVRIDTRWAAV